MTDHYENTIQRLELVKDEESPSEQEINTQSTADSKLEERSPVIPIKSNVVQESPKAEEESLSITTNEDESSQKPLVTDQNYGQYPQFRHLDYLQHQHSVGRRFRRQTVALNNWPVQIPFAPQSLGYNLRPQNSNMYLPTQYLPQGHPVPLYPYPPSYIPQEYVARPLAAQYQAHSYTTGTPTSFVATTGMHQGLSPSAQPHIDKSTSTKAAADRPYRSKQVRKHQCKKCGGLFLRPSALKVHFRIHTGERPFPCPFEDCPRNEKGKPFSVLSNMTRHIKISHGGCKFVPGHDKAASLA